MNQTVKQCGLVAFFVGSLFILSQVPAHALVMDFDPLSVFHLRKSQQANPHTPAEKYYREGIDNIAKGNFLQAQEAFQESLKADPKLLKSALGLAEVHFRKGEVDEAGTVLKDALAKFPENADLNAAWGRYLYLKKQFKDSEAAFQKAVTLDPKAAEVYVDLGDLYLNALSDTPQAITAYRSALSINPDLAGAHYALGMALLSSQKTDSAEIEFLEAKRLAPGNPLPLYALARFYTQQQDYPKALESLGKLLEINPNFMEAYVQRGDIYLASGDPLKALTEYEKALKDNPKPAAVYFKIGTAQQLRKQWNEAKESYAKAISMDPQQPFAYNNLAWVILETHGDVKEALTNAQKAVELAPAIGQLWDTLGWIQRASGQLGEAVTSLGKAVGLPNATDEMYYHLGVVYQELERKPEAAQALKKSVSGKQKFADLGDAQQRLNALQ